MLLKICPYICSIHGKFYEMTADNEEATIDYPGILAALIFPALMLVCLLGMRKTQ